MIYLDYAASTPIDPTVTEAMLQAQQYFANPSAVYLSGRKSKEQIDKAKSYIAKFLNAKSNEIVVTSGSSESNNLALFGVLDPGDHVVSLATEHVSVLEPIRQAEHRGVVCTVLPPSSDGVVDMVELERALTDQTKLISIALVTSETGVLQPITQITKLAMRVRLDRKARGVGQPLYVHTDASAAAWLLPLRVDRLGIDLLSFGGSKLYGPHGSGVLYVRRGVTIKPQIVGGNQQTGRRSGTEDVAGIIGLTQALKLIDKRRNDDYIHCEMLQDALLRNLAETFGSFTLHGTTKNLLPSIVNFSLPSINAEVVVNYLDAAGIEVGTGAACTAAQAEPSPVLLAMGVDSKLAQASLRVSFGRNTSEKDVITFVTELNKIVAKLDTMKA